MQTHISKQILIQIVTIVFILSVFIFFRWYKLADTLLFYNDMGRDSLVLLHWAESGKPPLLGPQTSVISYNQSAWYFYFLFPLFLLTKMSALSSTMTLTVIGVMTITALLWLFRTNNKVFIALSLFFLLLSVQPQVVLQNRFIWNPSFLPYFLVVALIAMLELSQQFTKKWASIYWLTAAFSVGFSYSAVPLVLLSSIVVLLLNKKELFKHLVIAIISAGIIMLPLLVFELRHNFSLTKLFFVGQTTPQTASGPDIKSSLLLEYVFPKSPYISSLGLAVTTGFGILLGLYLALKQTYKHKRQVMLLAGMLLISTGLLIFLPVNLEKHYIFPVVTVLFFCISFLPKPINIGLTVFLMIIWIQPFFILWHTTPPARSIADMETCYKNFCEHNDTAYYVSMESGVLVGYHNALEHQFFLKKSGCNIYDIEASQDKATIMLVINDSGNFNPGASGYRELSLFGDYTVGPETYCTENLSIQEINKPLLTDNDQEVFTAK